MRQLGLAALLFSVITLCQVFGAVAANSQALLLDCISMGVDAGSMAGNMVAEALKGTRFHRPAEIFVGGASMAVLLYFTLVAMAESLATIRQSDGSDEESVNAYIVFAFAMGGLLFDVISLYVFYRGHKKHKSGHEMNIWTAVMHVSADLLRSSTTLVLSLSIMCLSYSSAMLDAWASLLVGSTILLGGLGGLFGWTRNVAKYVREGR